MITVVVPIYNGAAYIPRFISILTEQTFRDFELIFICDESPDGSIELLKEKTAGVLFKCQILMRAERSGIGTARDYAIDKGLLQNEYTIFMDVDDVFTTDYFERLHRNAVEHHSDIVICAYKRVDAVDGSTISIEMVNYPDIVSPVDPSLPVSLINPAPWNKLIRTSVIQDCRFVTPKREDLMFFTKLIPYCKTISFIHDPLYSYQVNPNSDIAQGATEALEIGKKGLLDVRNFYSEHYLTHARFFPLLIAFAFLRVGIGMTTRACLGKSLREKRRIAAETRKYLDKEFRGWRYTKILGFSKMARLGIKGILLRHCKFLMKAHVFPLFVAEYTFYTKTFHRDIKW